MGTFAAQSAPRGAGVGAVLRKPVGLEPVIRETVSREAVTDLPAGARAASAARRFLRTVLTGWTAAGAAVDDAVLLASELVTNAVVHAGTDVTLRCRLVDVGAADEGEGAGAGAAEAAAESAADGADPAGDGMLVVEVTDRHATRILRPPQPEQAAGHGLQLVVALAESWGVSYERCSKTVWFRLALPRTAVGEGTPRLPHQAPPAYSASPVPSAEYVGPRGGGGAEPVLRADTPWAGPGAFSFLAETSDMLAGQFDEGMVASLAAQLLVPRLADWSAVWLEGTADVGAASGGREPRLAQVWHAHEDRIAPLRRALELEPPAAPAAARAVPVRWPGGSAAYGPGGAALGCRLVAGGRGVGTLLMGRAGVSRFPGEVSAVVEDFARRVAHAVSVAREYTRQATISQVLQRGLLPSGIAQIPGVDTAVVYEPAEGASAGGDFYDLFPVGGGRWCFALGDVCGCGPEAAVVTGLARPVLRLLAREGYGVGDVLAGLNRTLVEHAFEAVEAATAAEADAPGMPEQARFLSLLYGELIPKGEELGGGVTCTVASAGHPLPLLLRPDGDVHPAAGPQVLLGVVDDAEYRSESFDLAPGETLLCVTDGVTERRCGERLFDDGDGLATLLSDCTGLGAPGVAERIRRTVHDFAPAPPADDLALLVLQTR